MLADDGLIFFYRSSRGCVFVHVRLYSSVSPMCKRFRLSARSSLIKEISSQLFFFLGLVKVKQKNTIKFSGRAGGETEFRDNAREETQQMCRSGNVSASHHMSSFLFPFHAANDKKDCMLLWKRARKAKLKVS